MKWTADDRENPFHGKGATGVLKRVPFLLQRAAIGVVLGEDSSGHGTQVARGVFAACPV